jgi:5'/3'-nucleotidase SurE
MSTILLTSDDGYQNFGIRLLVHYLKNKHDLKIAGTLKQQSSVGGKCSLKDGGHWGTDSVDGIEALWVDGTPVDAIECAWPHFGQSFNLVISGINWGHNLTNCILSSGTFSAAFRSLTLGLAPKAMAISWDLPSDFWFHEHQEEQAIEPYLEYPGKIVADLIEAAIEAQFWNAQILNINLPAEPSHTARFTQTLEKADTFCQPVILNPNGTYTFPYEESRQNTFAPNTDVATLKQNIISISPCRADFTDTQLLQTLTTKELQL